MIEQVHTPQAVKRADPPKRRPFPASLRADLIHLLAEMLVSDVRHERSVPQGEVTVDHVMHGKPDAY